MEVPRLHHHHQEFSSSEHEIRVESAQSPQSFALSEKSSTESENADDGHQSREFGHSDYIRIPIIGYEVMEERARFTVFKLRVENPFTNDCWLVLRRYTDFVRLHNKMKQTFPQIKLHLPRKKIFGDNFGSIFLDNRVQGLQLFINSIMAHEPLKSSQFVKDFFCLDEPPAYSESMEECRAAFEAQEETICHLKVQLKEKEDLIAALQQKLTITIKENDLLKFKNKTDDEATVRSKDNENNYVQPDNDAVGNK